MKRNLWLYPSVALNIVLAGVLLRHPAHRAGWQSANVAASTTPTAVSAPNGSKPTPTSRKHESWVDTLRAAEIPEKLITKVAVADFETNWEQQRNMLQRQFENGDVDGETMKLFHLQHDAEEEKALRAAIGDEGFRRWDKDRLLREYNAPGINLSTKESDDLYALRKEMEQHRHDLALAVTKGEIDEATFEKQTEETQKQLEQKSKTVLGDERYAMVSKTDTLQGDLKRALASMNSNASQTETVLQTEQQWTDQQATLEKQLHDGKVTTAEYQQQMQALNATRDSEYQRQLGTNGFAQLQRAQDNRYRLMQHFASAWNLESSDIDTLYASIQSYENNSRNYLAGEHTLQDQGEVVDWTVVQTTLQQYSQATEDAFRKSLGDERFNRMKRSHVLTFSE